ncbi:polyketide cyclase [Sphingomonas oligophenolica]|uniref:Polyketide cyclase n=1 Tax=Sphingomonas oligophenolica TaxID=301154 RepID=A0A502CRM7_9SPHN|nr:polyketide cyclase [Sphingomonas oligophenolica]TPG14456.1 polyketide cyclase [Sphingomonas oligophenolica]
MLPARTFSVSIPRDWRELYAEIWQPDCFARWASGLTDSGLRCVGDEWLADGLDGPIRIRFTAHNAFGVMDHWVDTGSGKPLHIPLRVVANGEGAEVILTLYRQPDMTDERFAADIKWINRDLQALKALTTGKTRDDGARDQRSLP